MIFYSIYQKGYEAGYTKRECEDHEAQNRRLEDMLKYGKEIGRQTGFEEGWKKGYEYGYQEGEQSAKDEIGIIEINAELEEEHPDDPTDKPHLAPWDVYSQSELGL